ncbi:FeoB-associated Cys-rich membrane protein [Veillonella sp. VA142]|uniref:FeoB-associated Cys-rich membrane protein n=1 Tax=Veillonella sp. VA142 TaxID=741834 RepID=UPI000F8ED527|nr:FeoB-associated Cys-rich membrane protein [Veillonella sp. VA142]
MSSSIIVYAIGLVAVIYVAYRVYKSATSDGGGCGCGSSKDSGAGCGGCGCGGGHEAEEHK